MKFPSYTLWRMLPEGDRHEKYYSKCSLSIAFDPSATGQWTAIQELIDCHHPFAEFFPRREQLDWSWFYLCGQLSNLERKTIEPMVLSLLGANPNAVGDVQCFLDERLYLPQEWYCDGSSSTASSLRWMNETDDENMKKIHRTLANSFSTLIEQYDVLLNAIQSQN